MQLQARSRKEENRLRASQWKKQGAAQAPTLWAALQPSPQPTAPPQRSFHAQGCWAQMLFAQLQVSYWSFSGYKAHLWCHLFWSSPLSLTCCEAVHTSHILYNVALALCLYPALECSWILWPATGSAHLPLPCNKPQLQSTWWMEILLKVSQRELYSISHRKTPYNQRNKIVPSLLPQRHLSPWMLRLFFMFVSLYFSYIYVYQ